MNDTPDQGHPPAEQGRTPCPWNLLWATAGAAALVARADGRVHPAERMQLMSYLRRSELQALRNPLGMRLFDGLLRDIARHPGDRQRYLLETFAGYAGTPWSWVILRAAEHVASADGEVCDAELRAIDAIRAALDLPRGVPERYPACVLRGGRA